MPTCRLFSGVSGPGAQQTDATNYTMGVEFYVDAAADATHIHFWASTSLAGTYTGRIYLVDAVGDPTGATGSAVSGTDVTFGSIVSGWNTAALTSPVALTVNQRYRAAVQFTTDNGYTATSSYWGTGGPAAAGIVNGPLHAPNRGDATGNKQGSYTVGGSMAFPASEASNANYWVDVTVYNTDPVIGVAALPLGGLSLRVGTPYSDTYSDSYGTGDVLLTHPAVAALPLGRLTLGASSVAGVPAADPDDDGLNVSLYAVDSATGVLTALPHFTRLAVSEVRNGIGKVEVDYPVYGRNFDLLAATTLEDRDVEVEVWLVGKRGGAVRGVLTDTAGDDLTEDAVWTFEGWDLNVLLDEVLVWPQVGAEKQELILSGNNAGTIIAHLITQAQARGGLVGVTPGFTTAVDSDGVAWANVVTATFSPSATLLDVLQELIEINMIDGFRLGPDRALRMWNPGGQGVDLTTGDPVESRLWPATDGPGSNQVDSSDYTLGLEFYVTDPSTLTHVHYWWNGTGVETDHAWRLWQVTGAGTAESDGTLVDSGGAFGPMADGWTTATLGTPITLAADTRYRIGVYFTTNNGFTKTAAYWDSGAGASGRTDGALVAPSAAAATGNRQGSFNTTAGNFPYLVSGESNYWIDVTVETPSPPDRPAPVFRRGQNLLESPRRHTVRNSATTALVAGSDNLYDDADDASALARRGRRIEVAGSANSLKDAGSVTAYAQAMLATVTPGAHEITHGVLVESGRPIPWINYSAGDWVWSDTRNTLDRLRIQQVELEYGPDGYAGTVVLNTAVVDRVSAIARKLKRISSGTAVVGTSPAPADVVETDDGLAPAQVLGVTAASAAYVGNDGITWASVQAGWTAVTTNSDTSPASDIAGYFPAYRYTGVGMPTDWQVLGQVEVTAVDWSGVVPGKALEVRVAAVDKWGHVGAWSSAYSLTSGADATPPPVPSTPNVDSYLGILTVAWDGLGSVGETQPVDFARVDVHVSTSSGFTPDSSTKIDSLRAKGIIPWDGGTYGVTYYAKLIAYDKTGNASAASAQDSATLVQAADGDISAVSVGKLTVGIMSAIMTLSGIIRTASSGDRVEIDSDGIHCYDGTDLVFDFDISAGTVYVRGTVEAYQGANDRIVIQPTGPGSSLPEITFYAQATSPAYMNAFDAGSGRTGWGANSGNSADSGTTRRQTTLQLRPDRFALFYNTAPGDSAGASHERGAKVLGDDTKAQLSLYNSSALRASGIDVEGDEINAQIFDASGDREGGYFWLRRAGTGDTYFGNNDGSIDTYLRFDDGGDVVLRRVTDQALTFTSSTSDVRYSSSIRLTMGSSETILGQTGNTYIKLNASGNLEFYEGGSGYSSLSALKSFVIPHPVDETRWLIHGCTESPVAGIEQWGEVEIVDGQAEVELPGYFEAATRPDGRQVQLTPVNELCLVAASPIDDGRFTVRCSGPDGTRVAWLVKAVRADVAPFDPEPLRSDVDVRGTGPYRYIQPRRSDAHA